MKNCYKALLLVFALISGSQVYTMFTSTDSSTSEGSSLDKFQNKLRKKFTIDITFASPIDQNTFKEKKSQLGAKLATLTSDENEKENIRKEVFYLNNLVYSQEDKKTHPKLKNNFVLTTSRSRGAIEKIINDSGLEYSDLQIKQQ